MSKPQRLKCIFNCDDIDSIYNFPKPEYFTLERFKLWKSILKRCLEGKSDNYIYKNYRLCNNHFENRFIYPQSKRLSKAAYPTLNLDWDNAVVIEELSSKQEIDSEAVVDLTECMSTSDYTDVKEDDEEDADFQCNSCTKNIVGFRYVCVQCSDFDLCSKCEAKRFHDQHYMLRIPGPRPYKEIQKLLASIRKQFIASDPIQDTIPPDAVEENEEAHCQEAEHSEEQEDNVEDDIGKMDQDTNRDGADLLQILNTSDTELMADSNDERLTSKDNLDKIETSVEKPEIRNEAKPTIVKPIKKAKSGIIQKNIDNKPITSLTITKRKPDKTYRNNVKEPTTELSVTTTGMSEKVLNERRIVLNNNEFENFLISPPPVKRACVSPVTGDDQEADKLLASIREQFVASDPFQDAYDVVIILPDEIEENEKALSQEEEHSEEQEGNVEDDIGKLDQDTNRDEADLLTYTSNTELMADSNDEGLQSQDNLDIIETSVQKPEIRNEAKPTIVTPITKTKSEIIQRSIGNKPITSLTITKRKPEKTYRNNVTESTTELSVTTTTTGKSEKVINERRIILSSNKFEKFMISPPPVKRACVSPVTGDDQGAQNLLASIREQFVASDPFQDAYDVIIIPPDAIEENEKALSQEAEHSEEQEVNVEDDVGKMDQDTNRNKADLLQILNTSDIEPMADRNDDRLPPRDDLDIIETLIQNSEIRNEAKPTIVTSITKTKSGIIQKSAGYKPINSLVITKRKPEKTYRNNVKEPTTELSVTSTTTAGMTEKVLIEKRIILNSNEFETFLKSQPPVKRVCLSPLTGDDVRIVSDQEQPATCD